MVMLSRLEKQGKPILQTSEQKFTTITYTNGLQLPYLFYVFCTMQCDTIMQHKPTKCTPFKLML